MSGESIARDGRTPLTRQTLPAGATSLDVPDRLCHSQAESANSCLALGPGRVQGGLPGPDEELRGDVAVGRGPHGYSPR